jgi:hypothetical protein
MTGVTLTRPRCAFRFRAQRQLLYCRWSSKKITLNYPIAEVQIRYSLNIYNDKKIFYQNKRSNFKALVWIESGLKAPRLGLLYV